MQRQEYFNGIEKRLNWQLLRVKSRAKQNILDLNIFSETFFKDLLNLVYDLNLTNLNNKSKNAKAIDLLDDTNKVVFQVTSKTDKSKIYIDWQLPEKQVKYIKIYRKMNQDSYTLFSTLEGDKTNFEDIPLYHSCPQPK